MRGPLLLAVGESTNLSCQARKEAKQSATDSARGNLHIRLLSHFIYLLSFTSAPTLLHQP